MGLFDRYSKNQVNELPSVVVTWQSIFGGCRRKYADEYLWLVLQTIFDGLRNVRFTAASENDKLNELCEFLDTNCNLIVWQYFNLGFACVGRTIDGKFYIPDYNDITTDGNGRVRNFDVVMYSEKYMFERKSAMQMVRESLNAIDAYKNGEINLTENFGALGIMTGKGLPTNPAEKEEFEKKIKGTFGIQKEQRQIMMTTLPLDFKQMTLPVAQLQLSEKIENEVKWLCRFFNVPTDLVIGGSTFDNAKQATINFYRNCISPLAEVVLKVGRYMMKKDTTLLVPSSSLTFRIDNVAELKDDRSAIVDYKLKVVDLIAKMKAEGLPTEKIEKELLND